MSETGRDINDIFDDIVLTEESLTKSAYEEGFQAAVDEGNLEGYKLGYANGIDLGEELGVYYGTIVAHMQMTNSEKLKKTLHTLKIAIEQFPRTNDPEFDLISDIQNIRTQFKRIKVLLKLPSTTSSTTIDKSKDLSF